MCCEGGVVVTTDVLGGRGGGHCWCVKWEGWWSLLVC